jgi:putative FmdB family regulatory protein
VPTYEYLCASCGHRYEKQEGFNAKPRQKCPKCSKTANRVIFAPPIVFKGNGFYKTDSRSSGSNDTGSTPAAVPDTASTGHGHSHGPGGHTHDAPSTGSTDASADAAAAG